MELSGGIRDDASLERALATGCRRVNIGTAALENPEWCDRVIGEYGDRVAIGLDVRGTRLAARGWTREGGDLEETLERLNAAGCARYVVTDVASDGMLTGPNVGLLREVCERTDAKVVASGGIATLDDLRVLRELVPLGVEGAIIGTALYVAQLHPGGRSRRRWVVASAVPRSKSARRAAPQVQEHVGHIREGPPVADPGPPLPAAAAATSPQLPATLEVDLTAQQRLAGHDQAPGQGARATTPSRPAGPCNGRPADGGNEVRAPDHPVALVEHVVEVLGDRFSVGDHDRVGRGIEGAVPVVAVQHRQQLLAGPHRLRQGEGHRGGWEGPGLGPRG